MEAMPFNLSTTRLPGEFDETITRLQEALEEARSIPTWGIFLIVVVAFLCAIILLHVLALLMASPCLWAMWTRRKRAEKDRLLTERDTDDTDPETELAPAQESEPG